MPYYTGSFAIISFSDGLKPILGVSNKAMLMYCKLPGEVTISVQGSISMYISSSKKMQSENMAGLEYTCFVIINLMASH